MEKLNGLTELQIVKLYTKTNDRKYLDFVDNRIKELHDNNIDPTTLSNEQLTLLCQKYDNDIYWHTLYDKTKNSIHYCIHKYANEFYKAEYSISDNKEDTDLFALIRLGWYKAVRTYDITRGGAGFVAYASTIMFQHYIKLTRQINQKHNGLSVNTIYIESVHSNATNETANATTKSKMVDAVYTDNDTDDMASYEAQEYMKQKLQLLKKHDQTIYDVVVMHYFKNMTQSQIAQSFNRNKTWVARQLKRGKQFLRSRITDDEYLQVMKDLNKK